MHDYVRMVFHDVKAQSGHWRAGGRLGGHRGGEQTAPPATAVGGHQRVDGVVKVQQREHGMQLGVLEPVARAVGR